MTDTDSGTGFPTSDAAGDTPSPAPCDWPALEARFAELVDASPAERANAFAALASVDGPLADELAALLAAHDAVRAGDWLAPDALLPHARALVDDGAPASSSDDLAPTARAGQTLGAWRLVTRLGRGGMGEVWSAERADGAFAMDVAIKLVRRGFDSSDALRRFRVERQVLADLVHPGIARLLDGGTTDDGRPFLVMERVDGEPIDRHCEARALDVRARLSLFAQLCDAVASAHALGVVHRDLKPGNVLVTRAGAVKLLDFGIAKLLDDDVPHAPVETLTGLRLLTPRYASPEQVRGGAVTPATDVFALGVLLFELLAGRAPHGDGTGTPRELETAICDRPPALPSAVAPEPRRRALRGELDTIVLRALAKDPAQRYASAAALGEDVRRHLAGAPIVARRDTALERARRFARLHRGLVLSTLGTLLVLVAGLVAALVLHARSEGFRAESEWSAYASGLAAAEADVRSGRTADARARLHALPVVLRGWEHAHLLARLDGAALTVPTASGYCEPLPLGDGRLALLTSDGLALVRADGSHRTIALPLRTADGALAFDRARGRMWVATSFGALAAVEVDGDAVELLRAERATPGAPPLLACLSDGTLAFSDSTRIARLDPDTSAELAAWDAHAELVTSLLALPDGRLASGASDHLVRVWDAGGARLAEFTEHRQRVMALAYDAARDELVSAGFDGVIVVQRLSDGGVVLRLDTGVPFFSLALLDDQLFTLGDDWLVRRWERGTGRRIAQAAAQALSSFARGGPSGWPAMPFAVASRTHLTAWAADMADPPQLPASIFASALALDPSGRLLTVDAPDGRLRLWRLPERTLVWERRDAEIYSGVTIDAPRGRLVAGVVSARALAAFALDDGRELARVACPGEPDLGAQLMLVHALSDGRVVGGRVRESLVVWHPDGRLEVTPHPLSSGVSVLRLPDGVAPWCASSNGLAVVGLPAGHPSPLDGPLPGTLAAALHPDGERLALFTEGRGLSLVDLRSGAELAVLALEEIVQGLAFHPDGTRLACAGATGTVRLVDVPSWREVLTLHGHAGRVQQVRFTPDGDTLVSSGYEGRLLFWTSGR